MCITQLCLALMTLHANVDGLQLAIRGWMLWQPLDSQCNRKWLILYCHVFSLYTSIYLFYIFIYIYHIPSANLNHPETLKIIPMTGRFWDRNIQARPKNSNHPIIYWHNSLSSWPESMHARSKPDKWDKGWEGTGKKTMLFIAPLKINM